MLDLLQMNLGGAKDRAALDEIWENTQAMLDGKAAKYTTLSTIGTLSVLWKRVFG